MTIAIPFITVECVICQKRSLFIKTIMNYSKILTITYYGENRST